MITPDLDVPPVWRLFSYGRVQPIDGTNIIATATHTNVPRAGHVGLPMNWDASIDRWRAVTSIRFAEPVLEWASQTEAAFRFNDKLADRRPLIDLLFSSQSILEPDPNDAHYTRGRPSSRQPLWMRENLSYEVEVISNPGAVPKLQRWLVEHTQDYALITWIFLEGVIRPGPI